MVSIFNLISVKGELMKLTVGLYAPLCGGENGDLPFLHEGLLGSLDLGSSHKNDQLIGIGSDDFRSPFNGIAKNINDCIEMGGNKGGHFLEHWGIPVTGEVHRIIDGCPGRNNFPKLVFHLIGEGWNLEA